MNLSPHRHCIRATAGFLVVLALLAAPAGASPKDWSTFSPWRLLTALWQKIGLVVDPDGQPSDIGLEADPGGRSAPGHLVANIGLVVDPSGQPAVNPGSQDIGLVVDPNGAPHH